MGESLVPSKDGSFLKGWKNDWGGALELYPIEGGEEKDVGPPGVKRSGKVDVKWGNLVFFEVAPGKRLVSVSNLWNTARIEVVWNKAITL